MAIDLQIENISKSFGELELFSDISFTVEERQRIGLVARNGKGKSTLLKIIAGEEPWDNGKITLRNGVRVGYLEQEPEFAADITVLEACLQRSGKADIISRYEKALETGSRELQHLMEEMDRLDAWDYENRVKQVLSKLKINDFSQLVKELSGGQKKRVALAAVLIEQPDLMILDEPTNHLDMQSKDVLKAALKEFNGTVICVSHDRDFLDGLVDKVYEFGGGKVKEHLGGIYDFLRSKRIDSLQELEKKNQEVKGDRSEAKGDVTSAKLDYAAQKAAAAARRKKEKQIADIEAAIAKLEQEQQQLETLLADIAHQTTENFQRYEHIKHEMEQRLYEWEILSEEE